MNEAIALIISAALVNNYVLTQFLGLCPFIGVSNRADASLGMTFATGFVLTGAAGLCHILNVLVLVPLDLEYLRIVLFIVTIATFVQIVELIIRRTQPLLFQLLGLYLPLITSNCMVLGVVLLSSDQDVTLLTALLRAVGAAAGFGLALTLLSAIRMRLNTTSAPALMTGAPLALVSAGILAMAFMGFAGFANAR